MTTELTPRETILQHKEDLIIIAQELLSDRLSSKNLDAYNDLIWWIRSIENIEDYREADDYTVLWVLDCGFNECPLKNAENLDKERSCAEVDCPRFNTCDLTKGIFDKYM